MKDGYLRVLSPSSGRTISYLILRPKCSRFTPSRIVVFATKAPVSISHRMPSCGSVQAQICRTKTLSARVRRRWGDQTQFLSCACLPSSRLRQPSGAFMLPSLNGVVVKRDKVARLGRRGIVTASPTISRQGSFPKSSGMALRSMTQVPSKSKQHAREHKVSTMDFPHLDAKELPGKYDLSRWFACPHDLGDRSPLTTSEPRSNQAVRHDRRPHGSTA